jgi:hypothetical protein
LAVELEAFNRAEEKNYVRSTTPETVDGKIISMLKDLSAKFAQLQNESRGTDAASVENNS